MGWDDIQGQAGAICYLQAHLTSGRVAPAYLLAGPDGVGKRRLALEMAKALNCRMASAGACDRCASCAQISRLTHPDLHLMAPGGPSDQVRLEAVRHVLASIMLRPFNARFQVVILDGAERLTEEAANSLLKALEEPPASARFLLTTTRLSDCLPTVVSRCHVVRCRRLAREVLTRLVQQRVPVEPATADAVARLSGGSATAALALAARWESYRRTVTTVTAASATGWLEEPLPDTRQGVAQWLQTMIGCLRDVTFMAAGEAGWIAHRGDEEALRACAARLAVDRCLEGALALEELREAVDRFANPRLVATMAREQWLRMLSA
jgi:DNA polymerase-3 subunit delta'